MPLYNRRKRYIKKSLKIYKECYWEIRKELEDAHKMLDLLGILREMDGVKLTVSERLKKISPDKYRFQDRKIVEITCGYCHRFIQDVDVCPYCNNKF